MEGNVQNDERLMKVFAAALEKPPAERPAFLRLACGEDEEFLREAEEMVKEEESMGSFLLHPMIALQPLPRPFEPGQVILERFEIIREIGEGGMGVVYEAFDRKRGLRIAVKAAKPGFQRLLSPELEGALTVRHPNVCLVNEIYTMRTELGEIDFLTMELLEGETLATYLKAKGKLPEAEALTIGRQLCLGLAEAHRSGVIHRDLKSANVILCRTPGGGVRAVITDFGLAGAVSEANDFAGTPEYMAPELWKGVKTSKASDIYALGVVLYELVAGQTAKRLGGEEAWTPDTAGLSTPWARTLTHCLAASPEARPKDAEEVLTGLEKRPSAWRLLAAVPLMGALALCFPQVQTWAHDRIWPPPNVRLALLPATGTDPALAMAGGILQDVAERISHLTSGARLVEVIAPADAKRIHVETAEQAQQAHATHVLETSMRKDGSDVVVDGALVDLRTHERVRHFSNRYSEETYGAIPAAITGTVSDGLDLQGNPKADALSPAATSAYDQGLQFLNKESSNPEQAAQYFREAAGLDARSPLPLAGLVEAEVQSFDTTKESSLLDDARRALQAAERLNPDSISVHFAAGRLDEATGEYEKARTQYLRAGEIEPHSVRALLLLARTYDKLGLPEKAVETYKAAINLDPAFYKPHQNFGVYYYNHAQFAEAADQFRKVTELAPNLYRAYSNLSAALQQTGQNADAEHALLTSLKIEENVGALNNLGNLLASEKRDAEAIPYYERAVALEPTYERLFNLADSNRRLGHASMAQGQYKKAMDMARAEFRENPRSAYAHASVAYCAAYLGLRERAEDEIKQALQLAHGDRRITDLAVITYVVLDQRALALAVLEGATPAVLTEISREPDLADFSQDPHFKQLVATNTKGDKK